MSITPGNPDDANMSVDTMGNIPIDGDKKQYLMGSMADPGTPKFKKDSYR